MVDRDFKGVWIPKEIWLDKNLTLLDKAIMVEVDSLDRKEELGCFAGNEHFAEMFGCTTRKVSDSISKLIKNGYVKVIRYDGRKRFLRSCISVALEDILKSFQSDTNKFSNQTNEIFQSDSRNVPHSKPYRETSKKDIYIFGFDKFWEVYPKRESKQDAIKAWSSLKPDEALIETIVVDVKRRRDNNWREVRYWPGGGKYLRQRMWEDEPNISEEKKEQPFDWRNLSPRELMRLQDEEMLKDQQREGIGLFK